MPVNKKAASGKRTFRGPGVLGSMKAAKQSAKSGGKIDPRLKLIMAEQDFSVRFLTEPDAWAGFYEHYDGQDFFPCWGGECCGDYGKASFRYLANIWSEDDSKVMALKLPQKLGEEIIARAEKSGTIMDRYWDISRVGNTLTTTKYFAVPDSPSRWKMPKGSHLVDLEELLTDLVNNIGAADVDDEPDEEEDERPARKNSRLAQGGYRPKKSSRSVLDDEDDDEEDEYEDDDEDEDEEPPRRPARKVGSSRSTTAKKRVVSRRR